MLGVPTSLAILISYSNRKYAISMYVRRRDIYMYIYIYVCIYVYILKYMDIWILLFIAAMPWRCAIIGESSKSN